MPNISRLIRADNTRVVRSAAWLFLGLLGIHAALLVWFSHSGFDLNDEGHELAQVIRIVAGQVPYRDFDPLYAPIVKYLYAALFKLFGVRLLLMRQITIAVIVAIAFVGFAIARRILPDGWAAAAAILGVSALGFPLYTYNHAFATLLVLLCVWLATVSVWDGASSRSRAAVIGALTGLAIVIHWPMGLLFLGGFVASALSLRSARPRDIGVLVVAALALPAAYYIGVMSWFRLSLAQVAFPLVGVHVYAHPPSWRDFLELLAVPTTFDRANRWGNRFRIFFPATVVSVFWLATVLGARWPRGQRLLIALAVVQTFLLGKWMVDSDAPPLAFQDQVAFILFVAILSLVVERLDPRLRWFGRTAVAPVLLCVYVVYAAPWTLTHLLGSIKDDRAITVAGERFYVDPQLASFVTDFQTFFAGVKTTENCCVFLGLVPMLHHVAGVVSPLRTDRLSSDSHGLDTAAALSETMEQVVHIGVRWVGVMRSPANMRWNDIDRVVDQVLDRHYKLVRRLVGRVPDQSAPEITDYEMDIYERRSTPD